MEFIALNASPLPLRERASLYAMSAFPAVPFTPSSLNDLDGSLRDVRVSGPRTIPTVSMFTLIVSSGAFRTMSLRLSFPVRSALEKLYRFRWDILALPLMSAARRPDACTFMVSGMNVCSESNEAVRLPSIFNSGSSPRRSLAPASASSFMPTVLTAASSMSTLILPLSSVSAFAVRPSLMS